MAIGPNAFFQLLPDRASQTLLEPFDAPRLWLTFIVDAVPISLRRVIMIKLFQHKLPPKQIKAFSTLLFILGVPRIAATIGHQARSPNR
jgi:uncharacterized membrane protein (DUF373 family)